ncbi:MAG: hypothetical protein ACP5UA_10525 [Candidatus Hydrogenedens sp.]
MKKGPCSMVKEIEQTSFTNYEMTHRKPTRCRCFFEIGTRDDTMEGI